MIDDESGLGTHPIPDDHEIPSRFFCKLFDDMIIKSLCVARRRELVGRSKFSCTGCSRDRVMTRLHQLRRLPTTE